jgi:hypothetical protein
MFWFLLVTFFFIPSVCIAYIDPGTTGVFSSFLGYIIASIVVLIGVFRRYIMNVFKYIFRKTKQKAD